MTRSVKRTLLIMVLLLLTAALIMNEVATTQAAETTCVLPESGPWPACATGSENTTNAPTLPAVIDDDTCVIPETGRWPACATGGYRNPPPAVPDENCVIPSSGAWPDCATQGSTEKAESEAAAIFAFAMTPDKVQPGRQTVTLSWRTNADLVELYYQGTVTEFDGRDNSLTTEIDAGLYQSFVIVAHKGKSKVEATLNIYCAADSWFFNNPPEGCPVPADGSGVSAIQFFEHGIMRWHKNGDFQRIHVFYNDGTHDAFQDFWYEPAAEDSNPTLVPPEGLYKPMRGFGVLWSDPAVRSKLGWAITEEAGYSGHIQCTGPALYDLTCWGSTPNNQIIVWNNDTWWTIWNDSQ